MADIITEIVDATVERLEPLKAPPFNCDLSDLPADKGDLRGKKYVQVAAISCGSSNTGDLNKDVYTIQIDLQVQDLHSNRAAYPVMTEIKRLLNRYELPVTAAMIVSRIVPSGWRFISRNQNSVYSYRLSFVFQVWQQSDC